MTRPRYRLFSVCVVVTTVIADWFSKCYAVRHFENASSVGSVLRGVVAYDAGYSLDHRVQSWWFLTGVRVVALGLLSLLWFWRRSWLMATGAGFLLGGLVGNYLSLTTGSRRIVDFIEVANYEIFNVADAASVLGATLCGASVILGVHERLRSQRVRVRSGETTAS